MSLLKKNVRDQTLRWDQAALHNTSQPLSAKLQKPRLNSERYCFSVEFSWHRVYAQKASQHFVGRTQLCAPYCFQDSGVRHWCRGQSPQPEKASCNADNQIRPLFQRQRKRPPVFPHGGLTPHSSAKFRLRHHDYRGPVSENSVIPNEWPKVPRTEVLCRNIVPRLMCPDNYEH
jgi:hypothetical protein